MTTISEGIRQIQEKVASLVEKKPWRVELGVGSFVTLHFGEPRVTSERTPSGETREYTFGAWHLWVYCSSWRLAAFTRSLTG